jgi:hypothetical protein
MMTLKWYNADGLKMGEQFIPRMISPVAINQTVRSHSLQGFSCLWNGGCELRWFKKGRELRFKCPSK